jgi:Cu/Ag efflux protein CusF
MKNLLSGLLLLGLLGPAARAADGKNCGCECCQGKDACCCVAEAAAETPKPAPAEQVASHPLKGVVMGILADKTALLVKHEEVPGVMRAMTMMFKVEPAVLTQVKRGDTIQARMSRRDDGWWLTGVEVIAAGKD